ncbi:hypothetical protein H6A64_03055 [Lacrimispora saccharolytica]|nr:hypothetical protein [Lacrimispora saccharolytica]
MERFELGVKSTFHDVRIRMENFYLSDAEPETYPTPDRKLVDEFGQWKNHSWPGKITSLDELRKTMDQNLGPAAYPFPSWNRWGGDSNRKLKNGTGFFSTFKTPDGLFRMFSRKSMRKIPGSMPKGWKTGKTIHG